MGDGEKTRKRLLQLLRLGPASVADLAKETGLTSNAVRFHLLPMEAEGQVRASGTRNPEGAGKPAVLYTIAPEAEASMSRAYAPALLALLEEAMAALPAQELIALLHRVGERIAPSQGDVTKPLDQRVKSASDLLNQLGGMTTVLRTPDGGYRIRGYGCPLGAVVSKQPCTCEAVEALISKVTNANARQCCDHSERPSCCFDISTDEAA
jgi:predicted ArsR family transcriptional regulator